MKTEIVNITPELAKSYLERNIKNRVLTKSQVDYFAKQMKNGQWMLTGQGISFDINGNLIDGQHRLSAIIKANTSIKMLVIFGLNPNSFKVYDTGRKRNGGDSLSILGVENSRNISSMISQYHSLKSNWQTGERSQVEQKLTNTDIVNYYYECPSFWDKIHKESYRCYCKLRILKCSVIGSVAAYLIKDKGHSFDYVIDFFKMIVGINQPTNITIELFRNSLLKSLLSKNKTTASYKRALLIKTWNAYLNNKQMKCLKFNPEIDHFPKFE